MDVFLGVPLDGPDKLAAPRLSNAEISHGSVQSPSCLHPFDEGPNVLVDGWTPAEPAGLLAVFAGKMASGIRGCQWAKERRIAHLARKLGLQAACTRITLTSLKPRLGVHVSKERR